jgi:hypothetical protein
MKPSKSLQTFLLDATASSDGRNQRHDETDAQESRSEPGEKVAPAEFPLLKISVNGGYPIVSHFPQNERQYHWNIADFRLRIR